jgi:hypothetical protein
MVTNIKKKFLTRFYKDEYAGNDDASNVNARVIK